MTVFIFSSGDAQRSIREYFGGQRHGQSITRQAETPAVSLPTDLSGEVENINDNAESETARYYRRLRLKALMKNNYGTRFS